MRPMRGTRPVPGQPWDSVVPSRAAVGYPDAGKLLAAPRKLCQLCRNPYAVDAVGRG